MDKELAWILGYFCAEGSISDQKNKMILSFGSQNKEYIHRLKRYFDSLLEEKLEIIVSLDKRTNRRMYYYRIQRIPIIALFKHGFGMGQKSEGKRIPNFIFSAENIIKESFLRGYLDGDGSRKKGKGYRSHFKRFSTKSKELALGLHFLLKSIDHKKNAFGKKIECISWGYRKDKPGIVNLRLQGIKRGLEEKDNYCLARIKEINKIEEHSSVYDLEVEGCHNFVDAEGMILVHNTDSLFLVHKNKKDVTDFMNEVNAALPEKMELELEGFYPRGVFVSKKGNEKGAKKKYALLAEDGRIKIRGFELVRRDWSEIAKQTQKKVLEAILIDGSKEKAVKIIREVIAELNSGKVPLEMLAISTQLNKNPDNYEVKSPELSAAKKMIKAGIAAEKGSIISYVVGKKGASISEKAEPLELAKDYDTEYYITHQILPAVMKIMKELGYDEYSMRHGGKQQSLDNFF